jgi:predicted  nucleic acid-binding Zn-ribbon protein
MNRWQTVSSGRNRGVVKVELNAGEVIDKLTILRIKQCRVVDRAKLDHVQKELAVLQRAREKLPSSVELRQLENHLQEINEQIWDVEDAVRMHEREQDFGNHFVQLARSVYQLNDRRAKLKQKISEAAGSSWIEQKSHLDTHATVH